MIWAGDAPSGSEGVFRQSSRLRNGSFPDSAAFVMIALAVFTLFSTRPFDWL